MSEYQYYEFAAIDRPLAREEMAQLRAVSTRAEITPTGFVNHYEWGELKADPAEWMRRYFDAYVYFANWCTCQLSLRVPRAAFDDAALEPFPAEYGLRIEPTPQHWIFDWTLDESENFDRFAGEDGSGWMRRLLPLREELLRGDLRPLYLGWLAGASAGDVENEALEPPAPPGLATLTPAQQALVEFLEIDPDLLTAAQAGVAPGPQPALAALKSLVLPGLGQWHNGQIERAVWFFLAFALLSVPGVAVVALWLPPAWTAPALAAGLLLTLGVWIGSIVDAWRTARRGALPVLDPLPGLAPAGTPVWRMAGVTLLLILLCDVVALPLLMLAVRAYAVEPFRIPSASMAPALWPGDLVFAEKRYAHWFFGTPVRRGDVAIFAYPNDRTVLYVKRVVALPGDRVQLRGGELRVNGEPSPVPPAPEMPAAELAAARIPPGGLPPEKRPADWDLVVPPGQVFVLGDRREASTDSRDFGPVPMQDVVGRVRQVWFSWGPQGVRWDRLGHVVR